MIHIWRVYDWIKSENIGFFTNELAAEEVKDFILRTNPDYRPGNVEIFHEEAWETYAAWGGVPN